MRIFQVHIPARRVVFILGEIALLYLCFILAALLLDYDVALYLQYERGLEQFSIAVAMFVAGIYFHDLDQTLMVRSRFALAQYIVQICGLTMLMQALLAYVVPEYSVPQRAMLLGTAMAAVLMLGWRVMYSELTFRGIGSEHLLFLGTSETVQAVARRLSERPEFGQVCGFVDDPGGAELGLNILGPLSRLREIISEVSPDRLVVGMRERRNRLPTEELLHLRFTGLRIEEAATTYERVMGRVAIRELNPSHLIYSTDLGPSHSKLQLQMAYSFVLAVVGLIVTAPIMAVVAVLVRLTSPGPVLFSQQRVGLHGKPFMLYKFRSMVVDAEARTGAVWATQNDPRVTPVGRWLRKLRLDELPQLYNVLRGHMAIVGPRPERPEFVRALVEQIPFYPQRHYVRPGITGWAQINYKYGDTIEDTVIKLEYDLYYIKNMSVSLDFYCIVHTIRVMLQAEAGQ
jgi:sugar transferase (PEP-CTERM system associated)